MTISGSVDEAYWGARGSFKLGVIPSLEKEIRYYGVLKRTTGNPRIEELMNKYILQTTYKLKAAKELLIIRFNHMKEEYVRTVIVQMLIAMKIGEKVAAMIRSFVIN